MGFGFDPKDPEHQKGNFIDKPGRYVCHIETFHRHETRKGQQAIVAHCKVLLGDRKDAEINRMFMLEGGGTRWTADLFNAIGSDGVNDVMDDVEMSLQLGRRPFAAQCDWGNPVQGKTRKGSNEPLRYMEIQEIFPIDNNEQMALQNVSYYPGIQAGTSIVTEKVKKESAGPQDDVPHPADRDDGPSQAGSWGSSPPPRDDDIPFD